MRGSRAGFSPAQRTLEARGRGATLAHGRMRGCLASGHAEPSGGQLSWMACASPGLDFLANGPDKARELARERHHDLVVIDVPGIQAPVLGR